MAMRTAMSSAVRTRRRGVAVIYLIAGLGALLCISCFAVDYGRALVVKGELQLAADAASRHALAGLRQGVSVAQYRALDAADDNKADGTTVALDVTQDVEFGRWDKDARTFTELTGYARESANAVRVTARRTAARGNAVPLPFGSLLRRPSIDVQVTSVASYVRTLTSEQEVAAVANPWLAGMPANTLANVGNPADNPDRAPNNSPQLLSVRLKPGTALSFDSIVGNANNGPGNGTNMYTPDGNTGNVVHNLLGAEWGKSDVYAPINALMGVFLSDALPSLSAAPATLDFSTSQSRDFVSLSPQLRQVFFIGDGRNSRGEIQRFVVPAGATRLYLGIMDRYEWNNNNGEFTVTTYQDDVVGVVR